MRGIVAAALVLALCGCLSGMATESASASNRTVSGDCSLQADMRAQDECHSRKAVEERDATVCERINDSSRRTGCKINVNLESALQKPAKTTLTTTSATTSTSASTTSTTETTTTTLPASAPETIGECIRKSTGYETAVIYYAYGQGCGSRHLDNVKTVSQQTGIGITPILMKTVGEERSLSLLECFYGPYFEGNKAFKTCPRMLCTRTGIVSDIGDTTSNSVQSQMLKYVRECASSDLPPAAAPTEAQPEPAAKSPDAETPPEREQANCTRTTPMDLYVKGTTTGRNGARTDLCVISEKYPDHDRVRKYYCAPDGSVSAIEHTCPIICADGACQRIRVN